MTVDGAKEEQLMESIGLFNSEKASFAINPKEHLVADTSRAMVKATPEALKKLGITFIIVIIAVCVLYGIGSVVIKFLGESSTTKVIFGCITGFILGLVYYLFLKIKSVFGSLLKPNLKSPESAVKSFLTALKNGFYGQAFNLLTDQAQSQANLDLPRNTPMQKSMPALDYSDLNTFTKFWASICFPWKLSEFSKMKKQAIGEDTSLVEAEIAIDRTIPQANEYGFTVKFMVVRRGDMWFMANGFFWPDIE
jgi:hypothetical protein